MIAAEHSVIIIPTYNEVENIGKIIPEIFAAVPAVSVLVVDDNSPDGTAEKVRQLMQHYPRLNVLQRQRDKGFARSYLDGFRQVLANNEMQAVVMMDADFSHDPAELPAMLQQLQRADVVLGSRYAQARQFADISIWRRYLSRFANKYVQVLLGLPVTDCTAGFIALRTTVLPRLRLETARAEGYGFLVELKYRAYRLGLRLQEHPVDWPKRHTGKSKMSKKIIFESFLLPWRILLANRVMPAPRRRSP